MTTSPDLLPWSKRDPIRVADTRESWPLHDAGSTRAAESLARARAGERVLMKRAGHAVARLARALAPHASRAWVLCGPGGNGGDGLHAAAHLRRAGLAVEVSLLAEPLNLPAECREALQAAREAGCAVTNALPEVPACDLAIDALLGIGTHRAPSPDFEAGIEAFNRCRAPHRLAVDMPSGLDAGRGMPLGARAVQATATLSLLTLKLGLYTGEGRDHAGEIWFDSLGCDAEGMRSPVARLAGERDRTEARRMRRHADHKGSLGDVVVVGGAPGMTGAARLAAHAALAAGPGRVFIGLMDALAARADVSRPEWLWLEEPGRLPAERWRDATVVCGCGGGAEIASVLPAILAGALRLVLDADGLNAVARDDSLRTLLRHRARQGRPSVLTPHPLEAARLLGSTTAAVQADRLAAARQLAQDLGAVVVLKGSGTITAAPDRLPVCNPTGSATLATGGTGDVLAGWIGGWWAQSSPHALESAAPAQLDHARAVAAASAWLHGQAATPGEMGEASGMPAVRALELVEGMRRRAAEEASTDP